MPGTPRTTTRLFFFDELDEIELAQARKLAEEELQLARQGKLGRMATDFVSTIERRRSQVDAGAETWESSPTASSADASHLEGLSFDAPKAQTWLQQLDDTPEEDILTEAVLESLQERGLGPAHAPAAVSAEDEQRLQELAARILEMRNEFEKEREALGKATEDIARQEADLKTREKALEEEREKQRVADEERRNYPQPSWLEGSEGTMNLGVVGNAGVGKSLLINKLRRVRPGADGWAPVGVNETTMRPTMYAFPGEQRVRLWDLPGAGTPSFPSETYIQNMGLRYFDRVLIVTAGRFTSMEIDVKAELEEHKVPYVMVRTKADIDVWNNWEDNQLDEKATVAQIREDICQTHGISRTFIVSSRDPDAYDFPEILNELFPGLQRRLDPSAPSFCPEAKGWGDAWAMPVAYSATLAGMQGRWRDAYGAVYLVQGQQAHVTLANGRSAVVALTEDGDCVWWVSRWWINSSSIQRARKSLELRWAPKDIREKPLVWRWYD